MQDYALLTCAVTVWSGKGNAGPCGLQFLQQPQVVWNVLVFYLTRSFMKSTSKRLKVQDLCEIVSCLHSRQGHDFNLLRRHETC